MLDANVSRLSDLTLERAIIAMIFADNRNMNRLHGLTPEDLTDPIMAAALAAAIDLHADERPVSLVNMKSRLEGIRIDDDLTAINVVRSLSVGSSLPSFGDIALRLRTLATKRRLADYLYGIAGSIVDESQPLNFLLADVLQQLNDELAATVDEIKTSFSLHEAALEFIDWLQSDDDPIEITTGLRDLDKATGGWHRGQFIILAARPSMGKSAIALGSAIRTAEKGHGVLFFSLEMTKPQLIARALSDFAYISNDAISYSDLKPKLTDPKRKERLDKAAERMAGIPLDVETKSGLTVSDIMVRARSASEHFKSIGKPMGLIVVDHMLKIEPSRRYAGQPVKEIDEISNAMCVMAKTLNVAVLGLHQLNRGTEGRENPRAVMSDLRGSGSLEQDADVVLLPYRPAYPYERQIQDDPAQKEAATIKLNAVKNKLEIQIAKQRQGPTSTLEFYVDMRANVVRDQSWKRY